MSRYRSISSPHKGLSRCKWNTLLDDPEVHLHRDNPLCGDEIDLYLDIEDGVVTGLGFEGKGCSISQASISMMTEKLKGRSVSDAEGMAGVFKQMMQGENPEDLDSLGDLIALQGVQKYPVRIKCALLGWNTLLGRAEDSPMKSKAN